ncbi:MAG: hypothetical protein ABIN55_00550, partial [Aeromicrobium sp.]
EVWWPGLLTPIAVIPLCVLALRLFDRRDMGSGVWAAKPGPSRGSLHSSLGLAWRLQRGTLIGWTIGIALAGLAYGSIGEDVEDLLGDSSFTKETFGQAGGSLVDSFYAVLAMMVALMAAGFTISAVLRLRSEESQHFAELQLAAAEPRWRWAASHLSIAVFGTLLVVGAGGLGMGVGFAAVTGDSSAIVRLLVATLSYAVPVLVLAGVAWLAYALRPAWAMLGWAGLGFCVVVMLFGPSLQLPSWLMNISPFEHMAMMPAQDFELAPVAALLAIVAALGAGGMVGLKHRDLG